MSKYEEALENLIDKAVTKDVVCLKEYNIIKEAILKAKAFDVIKPFIKVYLTDISADSNPLGIEEYAIRLIMDCFSRDEEFIKLMTKALEVDEE